MTRRPYRKWEPIIDRAAEIVDSYNTGVTLRQLFYRLVAEGAIRNEQADYSHLSKLTAERRREGAFPNLIDPTRRVREPLTFAGADQARQWLVDQYRRDRTEGQAVSVYLGVEKHGMAAQLDAWFGDPFGVPILTLGGWTSQSFVNEVSEHIHRQYRPAVFLYAGDFDPSGWFICDEFVERVGLFETVERLALDPDQVDTLGLVENPAPDKVYRDPRVDRFVDLFGDVRQVEVDAIEPDTLRALYADAFAGYWDDDALREALEQEQADLAELTDDDDV